MVLIAVGAFSTIEPSVIAESIPFPILDPSSAAYFAATWPMLAAKPNGSMGMKVELTTMQTNAERDAAQHERFLG